MPFCAACSRVDFLNLFNISISQYRDKQEALSHNEDYALSRNYKGSEVRHQSDIFEVEKSSKDCRLCEVIFQAFKRANVRDVEVARGLEIIFRALHNKIEVCVDTKESQIEKFCGLDVYMDEPDVEELFRKCGIEEDDSPPVLKIMEKDPASERSFEIASQWLKNCRENHPSCRLPAELQKPPKRLLHVGNETQNPRLVDTLPELCVEWISLSYCWGGELSIKLSKCNMDDLKNGIPLTNLDAAFKDAVLVTRALGITYIWIDALCILQDGKEWSEEASKMNETYGGSAVTLVIASSDSAKKGFLKERGLNYIPLPFSTDSAEDHQAKIYLSPEWDDNEPESDWPWSERGWTMQEGLLPNRLLHYTATQTIWKCVEEQRYERGVTENAQKRISRTLAYSDYDDISFGSGFLFELPAFLKFKRFKNYLPVNLDYPLMSHSETFRLWYDLIEDYSQRSFTDISDRLVAISGLARLYGDMIQNPTYVAGLWREDLIRGLLWHVEDTVLVPKRSTDNIQGETLPSWSWVSVGYGVVKNYLAIHRNLHALSEIEDVQIDLVDLRDPFGAVKSGIVTITGPLKRLPRLYNKDWASAEASLLERHISEIVEKESQGSVEQKYSSPPGGHFSVMLVLGSLYSLHLLVLEATGETVNGINVYRRGGRLKLWYIDPQNPISPGLLAARKKSETSISARLGLIKRHAGREKVLTRYIWN